MRRGRRWLIRFEAASTPVERLADLATSWPGARLSPSGEITIPAGASGPDVTGILGFLNALDEPSGPSLE
jgi:hypothetical protein